MPFAPLTGTKTGECFRPLGSPSPGAAEPLDAHAFEAGRAHGRAEAMAEQAALAGDVRAALDAVGAWRDEARARHTQALVALAVEIARAIVGEALEADPERWVAIAARAVRRLAAPGPVTVRAAPRLAALLRAHAPALGDGASEVRVLEDATLAADACRVESGTGDVECGIAAQLEAVAAALGVDEP